MSRGNKRGIFISESITTRESASFKAYLRDISRIDLFTSPQKELECAIKALSGDENAKAELVNRNLRFVVSVAKKYEGVNAPLEDLVNQGNMGLFDAVDKFDPTKGLKFITYAVWYIRKEIFLFLNNNTSTIKLPSNKVNALPKFNNAVSLLSQELGREVCIEDLLDNLEGYTEKDIENMLEVTAIGTTSLDKQMGNNGEGGTLHDMLNNPDAVETDSLMIDNQNEELFNVLLSTLNSKEEMVIRMYFGIGYDYARNLDEIGTEVGLSREGVRQIKDKSLRKLRVNSNRMGVNQFTL